MALNVRRYHQALLEGPEEVLENAYDPDMAPVLYRKNRGPQRVDAGGTWIGGEVVAGAEPHKREKGPAEDTPGLWLPSDSGPDPAVGSAGPGSPHISRLNRALNHCWDLFDQMPYGWWYRGPVPSYAPAFAINEPLPSISWLGSQTIFCAGWPTLLLRAIGKRVPTYGNLSYDGGTYAYALYFRDYIRPFRLSDVEPGDLIGRYFRWNSSDQGHVAVVLNNLICSQSFDGGWWMEGGTNGPGLNKLYTVAQSHSGWYYEWRVPRRDWINYSGDELFRAVA